ncbi:ribonuclease Z [Mesonia ostreae]|uniref:Ribonuclease Z n=1 Tax=Mesonia ostreae TaxID=861110 RepID=A0ABU2KKC0_9FLAO|nr:ribonuclease Z [Mesonia ostreae]MDT0295153.1 ribonuclease Z [Mesonia ostreae]
MKIVEKDFYTVVEDEKDDIKKFASYLKGAGNKDIADKNLVVDILKYKQLDLSDLLAFLPISNQHRSQKKSFVLVSETLMIDDVPPELMVVPTLLEAKDVIQMEEIERDLDAF